MPLPLPTQAYSTEDQAQTRAQISQQLSAQQAQIRGLQTAVGAWPSWDLRYYAAQAGITLGQGNDQPAFDAAHAAMAAKATNAMLYVFVPPGLYRVDQLKIYSAAGFYCDPGAAMLRQTPQAAPQPIVAFGVIDDTEDEGSTATSWLLWGFKIDGQFYPNFLQEGGLSETTPGLFHYPPTPYNLFDPERGATIGQAGVYLRGAFADAAYPTIAGNSPFSTTGAPNRADGDARFICGELDICCVAGDGFFYQGTGEGIIGPIRTYGAGGRGIVLNTYDNKIGALDAGNCGLEGMVFHSQFSDTFVGQAKAWFTGQRTNAGNTAAGGLAQDAGHNQGYWLDTVLGVQANLQAQDTVGSSFRLDNPQLCHLDLHADYSALPPSAQTQVCGAMDISFGVDGVTAMQGGFIRLSVSPTPGGVFGRYPNYQYLIKASGPIMGAKIDISQDGMPTAIPGDSDVDFVDPAWFLSGALTLQGSFEPVLTSINGKTLTIDGTTVTFSLVSTMADVVSQINAAEISGVTAEQLYGDNGLVALVSTTGSPAAVTTYGSACSILGLPGGATSATAVTTTSQVYFDTATIWCDGIQVRGPLQVWPNSQGYVSIGLPPPSGQTLGPVLNMTSAGNASLYASGRSNSVALGVYDQNAPDIGITDGFEAIIYGQLNGASGAREIAFLGQYPPAPQQILPGGPLPTDGSATSAQLAALLNAVAAALNTFGLTNF